MNAAKRIVSILTWVLTAALALVVLLNIMSYVKRLKGDQCPTVLGFGTAVVITGSMKPEINENDLIVIHEEDSYEVDDIITYRGNTTPVTHRVIEKGSDEIGEYYVTQGDANNTSDGKIYSERVVGKVVLVLDGVGDVQMFLSTPAGFMLLTLSMLFLAFLPEMLIGVIAFMRKKRAESESVASSDKQTEDARDCD